MSRYEKKRPGHQLPSGMAYFWQLRYIYVGLVTFHRHIKRNEEADLICLFCVLKRGG